MKKIYYTWNQLEQDITKIAKILTVTEIKIDGIYGIPRGGLIPAVMLSHKLDIPLVTTLDNKKELLIVDDISDQGKTLKKLFNKKHPKGFVITLWIMNKTKFMPSWYCRIKNENEWVYYPWEI